MKKLERLQWIKDTVQQAVDRGARSVEDVHKYIADLPFDALQKSGLLTDDKFKLRDKQQQTIGMVYDGIRRINQQIGDLISDQLENLEDSQVVARVLKDKAADKKVTPSDA